MKMVHRKLFLSSVFVICFVFGSRSVFAQSSIVSTSASASILGDANIFDTSTDENKIYFNTTGEYAVEVTNTRLEGFAWGDTVGWVSLHCSNTDGGCTGDNGSWGVENDGAGNLSGFAWGENTGWISFSCENNDSCAGNDNAKVTIDPDTGVFSGFAWAENFGWISFNCTQMSECGTNDYGVVTGWTDTSGPVGGGIWPVTYLLQQGIEFDVAYDIYKQMFDENFDIDKFQIPDIDCSLDPELCVGSPQIGSDSDCSIYYSDCVVKPSLCDEKPSLCLKGLENIKPDKSKYENAFDLVIEKVQEVPNKYSIPAFIGFLLSGLGLLYARVRWLF